MRGRFARGLVALGDLAGVLLPTVLGDRLALALADAAAVVARGELPLYLRSNEDIDRMEG